MIIGIHPDNSGMESYSEKWVEFLEKRGVEVHILDLLSPDGLKQAPGRFLAQVFSKVAVWAVLVEKPLCRTMQS
jgi:hypothetical protein